MSRRPCLDAQSYIRRYAAEKGAEIRTLGLLHRGPEDRAGVQILFGTTGISQPYRQRSAWLMKKDTRSKVAPVALLILLGLVILVAVHRALTPHEVEKAVDKVAN